MLHAENQDRLYLIAQSDEQQALSEASPSTFRIATGWFIAHWVGINMRICRRRIC